MATVDISASEVQKLRQATGAGLMDCKRALSETNGDAEKAVDLLRERGIAKSSKRADRVAAEGLVTAWIADDARQGVLFELNSETDFVARNAEFVALAGTLINLVRENPSWTSPEALPQESLLAFSGKIGEKIEARRFARFEAGETGVVGTYIHAGSKLGVMVELGSEGPLPASEEIKILARELALQIAGANPSYVDRSSVPADVIEREKEIAKKQMEGEKKPPEILEKIAIGKLQQYYTQHCLLDQVHIRDASGKIRIKDLLDDAARKSGSGLRVVRFVRFLVGAD